jgi:hypothetical protein
VGAHSCVVRKVKGFEMGGTCTSEERADQVHEKSVTSQREGSL